MKVQYHITPPNYKMILLPRAYGKVDVYYYLEKNPRLKGHGKGEWTPEGLIISERLHNSAFAKAEGDFNKITWQIFVGDSWWSL